jgi:hypothetical protein
MNSSMEKKAEYQISSSVNEGVLEIILTGEVIESAAEKITNEVTAIIKGNSAENVLADVRAIKGRFFTEAFFVSEIILPKFMGLKSPLWTFLKTLTSNRFMKLQQRNPACYSNISPISMLQETGLRAIKETSGRLSL